VGVESRARNPRPRRTSARADCRTGSHDGDAPEYDPSKSGRASGYHHPVQEFRDYCTCHRNCEGQAGARLDFGGFGVSLDLDNIMDTRGNRFSFGNPFTVDERNQVTPLRPRTVRLGVDASF